MVAASSSSKAARAGPTSRAARRRLAVHRGADRGRDRRRVPADRGVRLRIDGRLDPRRVRRVLARLGPAPNGAMACAPAVGKLHIEQCDTPGCTVDVVGIDGPWESRSRPRQTVPSPRGCPGSRPATSTCARSTSARRVPAKPDQPGRGVHRRGRRSGSAGHHVGQPRPRGRGDEPMLAGSTGTTHAVLAVIGNVARATGRRSAAVGRIRVDDGGPRSCARGSTRAGSARPCCSSATS